MTKILKIDRYQKGEDVIVNTFPNAEACTKYLLEWLKK